MRLGFKMTIVCGLLMALSARPANAACIGDCGNRGVVGVDDLVTIVLIALGEQPLANCPEADPIGDGVQVNDIVASVESSLDGCPEVTPTPTTSGGVDTATPTEVAATATATEVPPTGVATPTSTEAPPTGVVTATATEVPPTGVATATATEEPTTGATATATEEPTTDATATATEEPTTDGTATATEVPPTSLATPTSTEVPPTGAATATETAAEATGTPTETPVPPTNTVTATPTEALPPCPIQAGRYSVNQVAGGTLKVDGGEPFAFPPGGVIIQEVSAASPPDCVHDVVVPFPGGFSAPTFCSVEAFTFSTSLEQIGCGRGYIDSNGGADFTVTERGDTSSPVICGLGQACTLGVDNSLQVNLTLGDGVPDTCPGGGTVNSFVGIPVHTLTWQDLEGDCPDLDGQYDAGDDTLVTDFNQNLDFTTDASNADWEDLDPDGCCIRGSGPGATNPPGVCNTAPAGLSAAGVCIDLGTMTVTTGSTGMVGSTGAPLYDLTFSSTLPSTISGPDEATGATCGTFPLPPATGGTITRCIE